MFLFFNLLRGFGLNMFCVFVVAETVYHSSGVLSNLSSSWTSKPPLAVKYQFEPGSISELGGPKSLCSTLERLLAWEKKLYHEVKVLENLIISINYFTIIVLINYFGSNLIRIFGHKRFPQNIGLRWSAAVLCNDRNVPGRCWEFGILYSHCFQLWVDRWWF